MGTAKRDSAGVPGSKVGRDGLRSPSEAPNESADFLPVAEEVCWLGRSELREENGKLKGLVVDLSLDRHILQWPAGQNRIGHFFGMTSIV